MVAARSRILKKIMGDITDAKREEEIISKLVAYTSDQVREERSRSGEERGDRKEKREERRRRFFLDICSLFLFSFSSSLFLFFCSFPF